MEKVNGFHSWKEGDWFLFKPINPSKEDKRKTIVIIKNKTSELLYFDPVGVLRKLKWENNQLSELGEFYSCWGFYKLNKEDINKYKKLCILQSL